MNLNEEGMLIKMENGNSPSISAIPKLEKKLLERIGNSKISLRIMHVCGTHERAIAKNGLRSVLPKSIEVISGPGCPVCVTPEEDIDIAIALARSGMTVVTFGDMMRVPGSSESLLDSKSEGTDVRMVYSMTMLLPLQKKSQNSK